MPDFATTLGVMIGLGVGIDYALFIVTRYREEHPRRPRRPRSRSAIAIDTAGRAVLFAGITVVISLLGMLSWASASSAASASAPPSSWWSRMVASVTLLPALLGFAGTRIEVTRWRGLIAAGLVAVALVGVGLEDPRRSLVGLPLAVVVLVGQLRLRPAAQARCPAGPRSPLDADARPTAGAASSSATRGRRCIGGAGVLLAAGHPGARPPPRLLRRGQLPRGHHHPPGLRPAGRGLRARLQRPAPRSSAELPDGHRPGRSSTQVTDAVAATPRASPFASPAVPNDPADPTAVLWRVIPTTAPQDEATDRPRRTASATTCCPRPPTGTGLDVAVTGQVAIAGRLLRLPRPPACPLFFGVVLGLSFLLLMAVFRSLLVPLKAVIMNLLSIGAAYGVVVAVFQWGWVQRPRSASEGAPDRAVHADDAVRHRLRPLDGLRGLPPLPHQGGVRPHRRQPHTSVADGLAATARVITAAAAIMVVVFGSFLLEADRVIKLFGIGLAVAVLLDATIVRMLLVPATMELLGDRNWWLPRWLDRLLPNIDVEGPSTHEDAEVADEPELVDAR